MGAPQTIVVILFTLNFVVNSLKHGEPKGNYNVGYSLADIGIYTGLLYWGGFWS